MNFYKYYDESQFKVEGYNIFLDDYFLDLMGYNLPIEPEAKKLFLSINRYSDTVLDSEETKLLLIFFEELKANKIIDRIENLEGKDDYKERINKLISLLKEALNEKCKVMIIGD